MGKTRQENRARCYRGMYALGPPQITFALETSASCPNQTYAFRCRGKFSPRPMSHVPFEFQRINNTNKEYSKFSNLAVGSLPPSSLSQDLSRLNRARHSHFSSTTPRTKRKANTNRYESRTISRFFPARKALLLSHEVRTNLYRVRTMQVSSNLCPVGTGTLSESRSFDRGRAKVCSVRANAAVPHVDTDAEQSNRTA